MEELRDSLSRSALREAARSLGCTSDEELLIRLDRAHTAGHARLFRRIEPGILAMLGELRNRRVKLERDDSFGLL